MAGEPQPLSCTFPVSPQDFLLAHITELEHGEQQIPEVPAPELEGAWHQPCLPAFLCSNAPDPSSNEVTPLLIVQMSSSGRSRSSSSSSGSSTNKRARTSKKQGCEIDVKATIDEVATLQRKIAKLHEAYGTGLTQEREEIAGRDKALAASLEKPRAEMKEEAAKLAEKTREAEELQRQAKRHQDKIAALEVEVGEKEARNTAVEESLALASEKTRQGQTTLLTKAISSRDELCQAIQSYVVAQTQLYRIDGGGESDGERGDPEAAAAAAAAPAGLPDLPSFG
jgi:uncharacterized phage infection (PIP) family protein YhgE